MEIYEDPVKTFRPTGWVGIAIKGDYIGKIFQLHIGILYLHENDQGLGETRLCHFLGGLPKNEPPSSSYYWITTPIDEDESFVVGAYCRAVGDPKINMRGIPYGFSFRDGLFDPNGRWLGVKGEGLTCATFVLAMFRTLGYDLIEIDSWEQKPKADIQEDKQWYGFISRYCQDDVDQKNPDSGDYYPRFRPEEVAVGANSENQPLIFTDAKTLGIELVEKLKEKYSRQERGT